MIAVEPWCARKLVEQAAAYAQGLGFAPHLNYKRRLGYLRRLHVDQCAQHFTFGREGKPFSPSTAAVPGKAKSRRDASSGNSTSAAVLENTITSWPLRIPNILAARSNDGIRRAVAPVYPGYRLRLNSVFRCRMVLRPVP